MEREGPEATIRLIRAIRSLAYNRRLQPLVEERIERAEATIRSHLLLQDATEVQVGPYEVQMNGAEEIQIARLAVDEWQQMPLSVTEENDNYFADMPQVGAGQQVKATSKPF